MIDYAQPCMMAETALDNAHKLMLERHYDGAIEQAITAMVEIKLMINSIKHMKEQEDALRQQAETV